LKTEERVSGHAWLQACKSLENRGLRQETGLKMGKKSRMPGTERRRAIAAAISNPD